MIFFLDYQHPKLAPIWFTDAEGIFTPEESGLYGFGLCVQGTARLYIDDELVVSFLGSGTLEETGAKELVAGQSYKVLVRWGSAKISKLKALGVVDFGHGGFRFIVCKRLGPQESMQQATELTRTVD